MIFVFDTSIVLHYIRESKVMTEIVHRFDPLGRENESWLSAVSLGEIRSIVMQNKWGEKRTAKLNAFLFQFLIADVNIGEIIHRYAEIDSFSQGVHPTIPSSHTARNMGKNDLWIAATSSLLNATLLTTDKDFDHLNDTFIRLTRLELV